MKERRSLVEGLRVDPELEKLEKAFVFGQSSPLAQQQPAIVAPEPKEEIIEPVAPAIVVVSEEPVEAAAKEGTPDSRILPQMHGRVPVTTRCRPEVASALKRASLKRQLAGSEPYYVQDIMEQALEYWLRERGYIN